jgi:hypothetical protein
MPVRWSEDHSGVLIVVLWCSRCTTAETRNSDGLGRLGEELGQFFKKFLGEANLYGTQLLDYLKFDSMLILEPNW